MERFVHRLVVQPIGKTTTQPITEPFYPVHCTSKKTPIRLRQPTRCSFHAHSSHRIKSPESASRKMRNVPSISSMPHKHNMQNMTKMPYTNESCINDTKTAVGKDRTRIIGTLVPARKSQNIFEHFVMNISTIETFPKILEPILTSSFGLPTPSDQKLKMAPKRCDENVSARKNVTSSSQVLLLL